MGASVGIIGGGISGLASAFQLAGHGHDVTVLESSDALGGLGTFFDHGDKKIDRFYHCIMPSDSHFLGLIEALGVTEKVYWRETFMGMVFENTHFPFNTPMDLLRFSSLSIPQRVRLGGMSLLLPHLGRESELDGVPIREWLTRLFGKSLWDRFWGPMFAAKFGVGAANLPSLYLSKRLGRESNVARRGYIDGGLFGLIEVLSRAILDRRGDIHLNTGVKEISQSGNTVTVRTNSGDSMEFDRVVSTIPLSILARAGGALDGADSLPDLTYQGVVNMLVFLNRPLDSYYWTPVLHSETGFDGVVESSALIKPEHYGGYHAAYLMKYCHRDSDLFLADEDQIADRWIDQFIEVYGSRGISAKNIEDRFVFKAPFVEPIYPLNYMRKRPSVRLGRSNVFLATTAQVYPYITSWNSSIRVAEECVAQVLEEL